VDIGFETIGNATLICHDRVPILVTDPWVTGSAYFGSWTFSHLIPDEQMDAIRKCRYVWVSHGHPDHLSSKSMRTLDAKKVLLPDHVGRRIYNSLREQGYDVQILPDRTWVSLTDRIRVMCIADYNQDGILLIDINGRLIANLNDANHLHGWGLFVRKIIKDYPISFLLALTGYGDADMINLYTENGESIPPVAGQKKPVGKSISRLTQVFGPKYFIPFSAMHRYQRKDSIWANQYTTPLTAHAEGFQSDTCKLLPAYIRYDCAKDDWTPINPPAREDAVYDPIEFGDDWNQDLDAEDVSKITKYFKAISHLEKHFDFINFRVAKRDHIVELAQNRFHRGITFEAPRNSLMCSIENEIFDDMLIGNFMKTTLHGKFPPGGGGLYPDFTPYVAKYADNGLAKSEEEMRAYFKEYRQRASFDYLLHRLEKKSIDVFRSFVPMDNPVYEFAKRTRFVESLRNKTLGA
jgi:hypothetical protein